MSVEKQFQTVNIKKKEAAISSFYHTGYSFALEKLCHPCEPYPGNTLHWGPCCACTHVNNTYSLRISFSHGILHSLHHLSSLGPHLPESAACADAPKITAQCYHSAPIFHLHLTCHCISFWIELFESDGSSFKQCGTATPHQSAGPLGVF